MYEILKQHMGREGDPPPPSPLSLFAIDYFKTVYCAACRVPKFLDFSMHGIKVLGELHADRLFKIPMLKN